MKKVTKVLVTGCAGFIGSHLVDALLKDGFFVIGVDNFNDYYDPKIKRVNLEDAIKNKSFRLFEADILDYDKIRNVFKNTKPQILIHLAARVGVRPSIEDPELYNDVNVQGTVNLLTLSVEYKISKFIFGSSSSVYGNSKNIPFPEYDPCNNIVSPYGSSKRAAEFFIESFWHTYGLKSVILRFFTVYGPRGRIDMAPALFTKAILEGRMISQFGDGSSSRDYTYIDDIVRGILMAIEKDLNFKILNLGNSSPLSLSDFISIIEKITGKKAIRKIVRKQQGDMENTWASNKKATNVLGWQPNINTETGLKRYVEWIKKRLFRTF